jgi:hypothetical protein
MSHNLWFWQSMKHRENAPAFGQKWETPVACIGISGSLTAPARNTGNGLHAQSAEFPT